MTRLTPHQPHEDVDATTQDADGDIAPGTMVGEYRIEHRIGIGGMGIVFAAVHPLIGKRVAIKVLRSDVCNDAVAVERFIDEARVVNQIEHPNIVDIFAFGALPDGRHYFVMEWLRGESLRMLTDRSRIPIGRACDILAPLARALSAAHQLGIVHRDLKPDNVFLVDVRGEQTQVKLLDFGVAKLGQVEQRPKRVSHTATGTIVGTPQYLSPEQAKGQAVDYRADIYALGGIAFELITGHPPFVADTAMEMVAKHLMEAPAWPSSLVPGVPRELDELVVAALAKNPADRPELAQWLAVIDLIRQSPELYEPQPRFAQSFSSFTPPPATPTPWPARPPQAVPTPPPFAPQPAKRTIPRGFVIALAAVAAIGVAAVIFTMVSDRQRDDRSLPPSAHVDAPAQTTPKLAPSEPAPPTPTPAPVHVADPPTVAPVPAPTAPEPTITAPLIPPKATHHHTWHAEPTTPGPAPSHADDDHDLLTPGSLPVVQDAGAR